MVGLCDGMLLLFAQPARQDGRRQDSFQKIFGKTFDGPSSPFRTFVARIPITAKDKSKIHQFADRNILTQCTACGEEEREKVGQVSVRTDSKAAQSSKTVIDSRGVEIEESDKNGSKTKDSWSMS